MGSNSANHLIKIVNMFHAKVERLANCHTFYLEEMIGTIAIGSPMMMFSHDRRSSVHGKYIPKSTSVFSDQWKKP